ncbi:MAG: thiol reductant ABC exporter subunit CydC [Egibacteraceae bacterium]
MATLTARRHPIIRLVPVVLTQRVVFALTVASILFHQVCSIGAVVTGAVIVGQVASGAGLAGIRGWLIALLALVIGRAAGYWAEMWIAHDLAYRLLIDFRMRVYDGVERAAPGGVLDRRTGDLANGAMSDVETLEWFYAHTVGNLIAAVIVPATALVVMGLVHPLLALALAPSLVVVGAAPFTLRRLADRQGTRLKGALASLHAEVVDSVQGLRELVTFGRARAQVEKVRRHSRALYAEQLRYGHRAGLEAGVAEAAMALGMFAVLALGAVMLADGRISFAAYPPAIVLAAYAFTPLVEVSVQLRNLGQLRGSADRVFAIIQAPANVTDRGGEAAVVGSPPDVRFQGVTFRYRPDDPDALRDVTFAVPAGVTVALVGPSGAGKSTCANLLLRFWDPAEGAILVDGVDSRQLSVEQLRDLVALVPQDVYLFNTTVRDNIRLGRPDATDAEVQAAADRAQVSEYLGELPDGLDTAIGERGATLSGGQRQRIAIARALLRDAPILVMDEAVSNLDTENEQALYAAMSEVRRGRTTLLIAHRLSTIRSADLVVVLDDGRVVETGPYDRLLAASGPFARLVAAQRHGHVQR